MKSRQWDGGKGDDSRIGSFTNYNNNFDKIDFSSMRVSKTYKPIRNLFLDDIRDPERTIIPSENKSLYKISGIHNWDVVRNYDEFVEYVETYGIPHVVSFDNDLDPYSEVYEVQSMMVDNNYDYRLLEQKTGCDCAEYLAKICVERNHQIPKYYIHTMNSQAVPIIKKILEDAKIQIKH